MLQLCFIALQDPISGQRFTSPQLNSGKSNVIEDLGVILPQTSDKQNEHSQIISRNQQILARKGLKKETGQVRKALLATFRNTTALLSELRDITTFITQII